MIVYTGVMERRTRRKFWGKEELARLRFAYEANIQSLRELGLLFQTSSGAITNLAHKHGWKMRGNK